MTHDGIVDTDAPSVGGWVTVGHPTVAELFARVGFDFLVIESEHAPNSLETVENLLRGIGAADGPPAIVRAPGDDPVTLRRLLDCGPAGVMVPMVETEAQARDIVRATTYPPDGTRGLGGSRATGYGIDRDEYVTSDEDLLRLVQIETERAVENVADIAAVDGVDGVFVGPTDLSLDLGVRDQYDAPAFEAAVDRVVSAARERDVAVGSIGVDEERVSRFLEWEFDFLVVSVDFVHLRRGAVAARDHFAEETDR